MLLIQPLFSPSSGGFPLGRTGPSIPKKQKKQRDFANGRLAFHAETGKSFREERVLLLCPYPLALGGRFRALTATSPSLSAWGLEWVGAAAAARSAEGLSRGLVSEGELAQGAGVEAGSTVFRRIPASRCQWPGVGWQRQCLRTWQD
jgi:hypothetical protein